MRVRVATAEDRGELAKLVLAFRDHLAARRPTEDELLGYLPEVLADERTEFCLALTEAGEAVGYGQCRIFPSLWGSGFEAHLEDLFVLESHRGRGIGEALIRFAIERAASRGAVGIGLHTNEANEAAQAFYRRIGFSPASEARWDGGREVYWVRAIRSEPERLQP